MARRWKIWRKEKVSAATVTDPITNSLIAAHRNETCSYQADSSESYLLVQVGDGPYDPIVLLVLALRANLVGTSTGGPHRLNRAGMTC